MSLLEKSKQLISSVEPDGVVFKGLSPGRDYYLRDKVESLLSQCRKEALLEAGEVCKTIANDAEDCGATPEMLEIVYAVEDELLRMAESDKTTMEGEK